MEDFHEISVVKIIMTPYVNHIFLYITFHVAFKKKKKASAQNVSA